VADYAAGRVGLPELVDVLLFHPVERAESPAMVQRWPNPGLPAVALVAPVHRL
jgi:hypothetical protein